MSKEIKFTSNVLILFHEIFNFLKLEQVLNGSTDTSWFLSNLNSRNLLNEIPNGIDVIPFCCNINDSSLFTLLFQIKNIHQ